MCFNSLWVSLEFGFFYYGEIGQPPSEHGLVAMDNELVN
jgi:hypothetical protein